MAISEGSLPKGIGYDRFGTVAAETGANLEATQSYPSSSG
jgi:hypothetical protein